MALKKRGKVWYIKFRPFGDQIQLALKDCRSEAQAEKIENAILDSLRRSDYSNLTGATREAMVRLFTSQQWEFPPELKPPTVQVPQQVFALWDAVQLYVNDPCFKDTKQTERVEISLAHLVGFFNKSKPVIEIKVPEIKAYRSYRQAMGITNATINREIASLSKLFRVLVEHEIVGSNPCHGISKLSDKSSQRQVYLSFVDVQRIMAECPGWFQDMIWISYLTGARKGEVHNLRWRHLNLNTRMITMHAIEVKEGKSKRIPIHRDLMPTFERLGKVRSLNDDQIFNVSSESLKKPWQRAMKKLGWGKPTPRFHDLRHSWKTNARRSGIDFEIREAILGHSNRKLDVSERYGFIDDYELVAAIDKFTYDNGLTQILVACNA